MPVGHPHSHSATPPSLFLSKGWALRPSRGSHLALWGHPCSPFAILLFTPTMRPWSFLPLQTTPTTGAWAAWTRSARCASTTPAAAAW